MDERLGTNIARSKGLETIGILGILIESKSSGLIPSVKSLVIALEEVGFYISKSLMKKILAQANEF
jgi:predicted nucleic acid-binding protein